MPIAAPLFLLLAAGAAMAATPDLLRLPAGAGAVRTSQRDWADSLGVPVEATNSLGMKLVLIPPGHFTLGPNGSTYRVTLSKPFYIAATEVTLGQYRRFRADHSVEGAEAEFNFADRPAAMVSWEEAREFCAWLSEQPAEKQVGRIYALPTQAQWEWAARAGTTTSRYFGEDVKGQVEYSWFNHTYTPNPERESAGRGRQAVAKLKPNAWGLFDMLGNVWEWCDDHHHDERTGEAREPVMCGGSWRSGAFHCTAVAHDPGSPRTEADHIGFRVVMTMRP
jgi:formylglycine-generating enzyme required for sulfatase activity